MNSRAFVASARILGGLMLGSACLALAVPGDAKAATASCTYSGTAWLVTGTATACGNLVVDDKSISSSSFGFSGYTLVNGDIVTLANSGAPGSLAYSVLFSPISQNLTAGGSFAYGIQITNPSYSFKNTFATVIGSNGTSDVYSNTVSSPDLVASSQTTGLGANGPTVNFASSGVSITTFTNAWSIGSGSIQTLGNTFQQQLNTSVPGPLPVLGAGAAFGFSRKLRKRIKQSV